MPRRKVYGRVLNVNITTHTGELIDRIVKARGLPDTSTLIREYLNAGITRDVVKYNLHLTNDGDTDE
jgi:hypothetical protein